MARIDRVDIDVVVTDVSKSDDQYLGCACFFDLPIAVAEGEKPEDLCIEAECPHVKRLFLPKYLDIVTLRYPPN